MLRESEREREKDREENEEGERREPEKCRGHVGCFV